MIALSNEVLELSYFWVLNTYDRKIMIILIIRTTILLTGGPSVNRAPIASVRAKASPSISNKWGAVGPMWISL